MDVAKEDVEFDGDGTPLEEVVGALVAAEGHVAVMKESPINRRGELSHKRLSCACATIQISSAPQAHEATTKGFISSYEASYGSHLLSTTCVRCAPRNKCRSIPHHQRISRCPYCRHG